MTDRDTFAAAALTGLIACMKDETCVEICESAYWWADSMLRERGDFRVSRNAKPNHDAVPAATADSTDERPPNAVSANGGTQGAASRDGSGTGDTPVAESATPDGYAYTGWPYPRGKAASVSDAEIDALQHVVEDGRFVDFGDYGRIRSLLVRLRPEWEDESDRQKSISNERLAALEELSALDQELEAKHGLQGNPMIKARRNNESM